MQWEQELAWKTECTQLRRGSGLRVSTRQLYGDQYRLPTSVSGEKTYLWSRVFEALFFVRKGVR